MGHARRRPWLVIALSALLVLLAVCTSDSGGGSGATGTTVAVGDRLTPQIGQLPRDALEIMSRAALRHGALVGARGEHGHRRGRAVAVADDLMVMGSNMKLYTIGTALDVLGPDDQITTPVHLVGDDLVLVGKGDPVMGGRNASPDGPLGYSLPPQFDANGLPGAKPAPGNPFAGLEDLAAQVAASGVTSVPGDVLVDTRLFEDWTPTQSTISPIVINDNLLGVITTPGAGRAGADLPDRSRDRGLPAGQRGRDGPRGPRHRHRASAEGRATRWWCPAPSRQAASPR